MPLKKFYSEPTTPSDMHTDHIPDNKMRVQDDLSLISESPKGSFPKDYVGLEHSPEEIEKKVIAKRESSPGVFKKKISR